jgi:hypothetical protein
MQDLRFLRKWYNQSFKPALLTALEDGKISKAAFDRLNKPVAKYEFDYK